MAELITPPTTVVLSRIITPVRLRAHAFYWLETSHAGFVSVVQPAILDRDGEPLSLSADLPAGSRVRVHTVAGYLRSVMVIEVKKDNPFA
jgi:hypothetical protein